MMLIDFVVLRFALRVDPLTFEYVSMWTCKYAGVRIWKYLGVWVGKQARKQVRKYAGK
jgi:hypothetical protein